MGIEKAEKTPPLPLKGLFCLETSSDASLVNGKLNQAISGLEEEEHPLVYSDRDGFRGLLVGEERVKQI